MPPPLLVTAQCGINPETFYGDRRKRESINCGVHFGVTHANDPNRWVLRLELPLSTFEFLVATICVGLQSGPHNWSVPVVFRINIDSSDASLTPLLFCLPNGVQVRVIGSYVTVGRDP